MILKESDQHSRRSDTCIVEGIGEMLSPVSSLDLNIQTAGLRVAKIGAGANLKILFLTRRPCLHIERLDLQICQIAGAALKGTYGYLKTS